MGQEHSAVLQDCLISAVGPGNLAFPSEPLYQLKHVKPYNLDIHVHPVAVTYPESNTEVAAIVQCAADNEVKVQARSGGHSYGNFGTFSSVEPGEARRNLLNSLTNDYVGTGNGVENTIVVDLKHFKQFSMDKKTWVATLGAGHLLGDVTNKLLANGGRAMAHGTCPQVGIGGHATIGGLGNILF